MNNVCESRYKLCRENAGLTQMQAAKILHVSERSLSDYETGKTRVPDDVVSEMAELYTSPLLAWWHLKNNSPLGRFLPTIMMPETNRDMAFHLVLAQDDFEPLVKSMKKIMADGEVSHDEEAEYEACREIIDQVCARMMSVKTFAGQVKIRKENTYGKNENSPRSA